MGFIKDNPIESLIAAVVAVFLVLILAGPVIALIKFVLMIIGGLTVAKWVFKALADE